MTFQRTFLFHSVTLLFLLTGGLFAGDPVERMETPGNGLNPQTAVSEDGTVHLLYFRGDSGAGNVFYTRKSADDEKFGEPVRVNQIDGSAIVKGTVRAPRLAVGENGRVHVVWMGSKKAQKELEMEEHPLLYTRSKREDGDVTFPKEKNLIGKAYGLDGGATVAASGKDVYVVWHANPKENGEENRSVWMVRSRDGGKEFSKDQQISSPKRGACGCCGINATVDASGKLFVLFRTAIDGFKRNVNLLFLEGGAESVKRKRLDGWNKNACPMSTYGIAGTGDRTALAWETKGQVYCSIFQKTENRLTKAISPPGEGKKRKHPAVAINDDGRILLAWTEGTGWDKGGKLAWQLFDGEGKPTDESGRVDGVDAWDRPAVYVKPDGTFVIVH